MWIWLLLLLLLCVVAAGAAVLVYMYYRCPQKLLFLLLPWMQRAYILYTKLQSLRPSRNQHSSIRHSPGAPAGAGGVGRTSPFFDDDASGKKSFARHHQPPQQKQHPYASLFHSEQHRSRSLWDDQVATSSYSTEQKKRNDIHAAPRRINEPGISSGNQWTRDTRHLRHRQRLQQQQQQQQYEKRHAPQTQDEEKTDWVYESDESRTDNNRPTSRGREKSGRPTQPLSTAAAPTAAATCTQAKETPVVQLQPVAPGAAAEVSPQPELEKEAAAPVLYDDGRRVDALQVLEERDTAARAVHEEVERSHAAADEEENVTSFSVSSLSSCRKKEEEEKESSNRNAVGNASLGGDECADLSLSDVGTPQAEIKPIFAGIEAATGAAALTTAAASDMEGETLRSTPLEEILSRKKEEGTGAREAVCVAQKEEEGSAGAFVAAAELGNEVTIEEAEERDSAASTCMQNNPSLTVRLSETLVSHDEGVSRTSFSTAAVESALDAAPYSEEAFPSPAGDAAAVPGATATEKRKFAFPVAAAARAAEAAAVGAPRSVQRLLQEEKEQQEMQGDDEREEEDDDSSQREDEEDGGRGGGEEEEEENIERDRTMYGRRFPPGGDTWGTVPKSCTNFTAGGREGREGGKEEKNLASVAKKVHSAGERNSEKAEDEKTQDISPDGVSLPRAEGGTRQGRKKATEKEVEKEKGEMVESSVHGREEGERREGEVHSSVSQIEEEQERERQESKKRKEVKKEEDGRSSSDEEEDATAAELKEKGNKKFRAASYDSAQEYYTLALDRLDEEEDDWLDEWDAVMQEKEEELEAAEALRQKKRREVQRYRSSSTTQGDKGSSEDEEVSSEEARESEEAEAELEKEAAGEKRVVEASSSEAKPEDAEGQQKEQRSPERREKEGEGGGGHGDQQQEEKKHKKKKKKEEKSDDGLLTEEGFEQFRVAKEKEREAKQQECNNLRAVLLANRAACHMQSGGWQQVLADCTEAIQCDSSYAKAYLRRYTANQALSKWHDALADINKALELDPSLEGRYRAHQQRVKKLSEQQFEKEKEEMLGKLKDFGNFVLGKVGLSLDNFKVEQNPETGSYNISFQQNAPAASSSTA